MSRLLLAALLLTSLAPAQQPHQKERLKFVLILSRHGIRPPLTPAATLSSFATDPWPSWPVPLGHLTPHGAEALRQLGAYMRTELDEQGLFSNTCPRPEDLYLYADTDERNISSTRATFTAFAPNCAPHPVYTWRFDPAHPEHRDPIFLPLEGTFSAPTGNPLGTPGNPLAPSPQTPGVPSSPTASSSTGVGGRIPDPALLRDLNHILAPSGTPSSPTASSSARVGSARTTLVENLELEYMDAKPLNDVGWGRLGATDDQAAQTLRHLLPLHINAFASKHRVSPLAQQENSNLLAHILDTLQQAAGSPVTGEPGITDTRTRINGAFGPPTARLVYISAHDTNLHGIAGLLNLHWTADGLTDEVPPDSQLVFELWQRPHKRPDIYPYTVRIRYRAQSLKQMREASALSATNPPIERDLHVLGCRGTSCTLANFLHAARATLAPTYIQLDTPPTQAAP